MAGMAGYGIRQSRFNKSMEDYFVGGRTITPSHIGLSIAATDVGGGFSIGLGGLGYLMGISGSWLLFTGLLGAWLSAVFIIPKIKTLDLQEGFLTYPEFLKFRYNGRVAAVAALISGIGYVGFTSGQILAGAKLMSGSIITEPLLGVGALSASIYIIGFVIVGYTVLGGLKAVVYTDTIQWIILISGLLFAIPFAVHEAGGLGSLLERLPDTHTSFTNISAIQFINWLISIVPIWLVAMTLYQRVYASRSVKDAQKAWFIAGAFEYPVMAMIGAILGTISSVLIPGVEAEMGVPILLREVLPVGITGIVVASYFSAIMSTADSCIIASSGNFVTDLIERRSSGNSTKQSIRLSQITTMVVGVVAILLATYFNSVLGAILYAYQFLVSGLFFPTLAAFYWKRATPTAALWAMITGGTLTLTLIVIDLNLPLGLDATFFGMIMSGIVLYAISVIQNPLKK